MHYGRNFPAIPSPPKCRPPLSAAIPPGELALVESENRFIEEATAIRHSAAGIASFFIPGLGQIMKGQRILTTIWVWFRDRRVAHAPIFMGGLVLLFILWCPT